MSKSIAFLGTTYDTAALDMALSGGGTARFHDRAIEYDFLGVEPECVNASLHSAQYTLNNTGYASWTPSTTASAIVSSSTLSPTYAANMAAYDYYLRWTFDCSVAYASGTTMKYTPRRECMEIWQVLQKRPSSSANITADNWNGNNCATFFSPGYLQYNDKNGTLTYTWSASYGFYISAAAATFSSSTSDTPNITIKTPAINARCSTTYFTTARAANVDQAKTKLALKGQLWRVKHDSCAIRQMYGYVVDIINDTIIT